MRTHTQTILAATLLLAGPFSVAHETPAGGAPTSTEASPIEGEVTKEGAPASEKETELKKLKKELEEIKERLDKAAAGSDVQGVQTDLENFKYQYQRDRDTKSALSNRNLLITGLIQSRFAYAGETLTTPVAGNIAASSVNNPPTLQERHSTFDTPNGIVGFSGLLYRDYQNARNLGFNFSLAASPSTSNIGAGANNTNSFATVLDANVVYQAFPTIENDGDRLSFTLGQQLLPFGLEANTTEELKPVINNAQFLVPTTFNTRQVGLVVKGEFFAQYDFGYNYRQAFISAAAGVVNGNGPNRDDDNNHKDRIYRLAITVPAEYQSWLRELRVGASLYQGVGDILDSNNKFIGYGTKNRYGYDFYYNHFPFGLTYEYVRLADGVIAANNTSAARLDRVARTATFFYSFGEQFLSSIKNQGKFDDWWPKTYQPFLRIDDWNANEALPGQKIRVLTAGLNIFFAETTKAQINYNRRTQENGSLPNVISNELLVQLQFGF
jgi:hypothetical protein